MADGASERLERWRGGGVRESFRGHGIHVHPPPAGGDGPLLVLLHGFPSSSYDFEPLLSELSDLDSLCFDFLGFGLSDKPREHTYSLLWQADLTEELIARHGAGRPVLLVAHDMGTSVATELLARDLSGGLGFELAATLLFNGSIVLDQARLSWVQRLLRSPLGPLAARLSTEQLFRRQFSRLFSAAHPVSESELADQWALLSSSGGAGIGDRLIYYLGERERFAARWHGAIADWPGPLSFAWGMEDPVATPQVLAALSELRPKAPVTELSDLGHYPQIEAPERVAAAVRAALDPLL